MLLVLGAALGGCDMNCQKTDSGTKKACTPKTGDPPPDANGNCANISGGGAIRVCINRCKKVATLGQACTNDLCKDGGSVCDAQLACLPDKNGVLKCSHASQKSCDADKSAQDNGCQGGTFCKLIGEDACPGLDASPPVTLCASWVSEGDTCDGDYSDTKPLPSVCWPCEPGTICVKPKGSSKGQCERACSTTDQAASCPCTGFRCIESSASKPAGSYCEQCAATYHACAVAGGGPAAPCCDATAQCNASTDDVCCRPVGTTCSAAGQCCAPAHASATCTAGGACGFQCDAGWADCNHSPADGCEVNVLTSTKNCGFCNHACPAGPAGGSEICVGGVCSQHCPSGYSLCGDSCVNFETDPHHCGSCGHACTGGPSGGSMVCTNGSCAPHCPPGLTDCSNACVNLKTSDSHCGGCTHSCGGQPCDNGSCAPGCSPFGTTCGPGITCCAPDTCKFVPAEQKDQCCNDIAPETGICTN